MNKLKLTQRLWCRFADEGDGAGESGAGGDTGVEAQGEPGDNPEQGASGTIDTFRHDDSDRDDFLQSVPEEYREKSYMKDIQTKDEFFKQFDNAQKLIGKKTVGLPGDDATQEDWDNYYNTLRPENPDGYEFEPIKLEGEGQEELEKSLNDIATAQGTDDKVREMFHKHGLTPQQAKGLHSDFNKLMVSQHLEAVKQNQEASAEINKSFEEIGRDLFKEAGYENVINTAKPMMTKYLPQEYKNKLSEFNGEVMALFAAYSYNIKQDMGAEDTIDRAGGGTGSSSGSTEQDLRAQLRSNFTKIRGMDALNPQREQLMNENRELSNRINSLTK